MITRFLLLATLLYGVALVVWFIRQFRHAHPWAANLPWRQRLRIAMETADAGLVFFRRGKASAWFVASLASETAPSAATVNAGTHLSAAVADIAGFATELNRVEVPVLKYAVAPQVDGPQTLGDATLTLIEDDGTGSDQDSLDRNAAFVALAEQVTGYIVLFPTTQVPASGAKCEVWPIRVGARNRSWSLDVEGARYTAQLAITGNPTKNAVCAA